MVGPFKDKSWYLFSSRSGLPLSHSYTKFLYSFMANRDVLNFESLNIKFDKTVDLRNFCFTYILHFKKIVDLLSIF